MIHAGTPMAAGASEDLPNCLREPSSARENDLVPDFCAEKLMAREHHDCAVVMGLPQPREL